jgi:hypothetical protein
MAFFGKSSIAGLETAVQNAQAELAAAEAAFTSAVQAMEAPPIELTDDQIGDLVGIKNLTEVRLVKARAGVRRADHALAEARAAAETKELADALARVMSLGKTAQKIAREELAAATKGMRRTIRAMAEAEGARRELNTKLPPDQRIESFEEAVLARPGIPEKIITSETKLRWVSSNGQPFDERDEALLVEDRATGTAKIKRSGPAAIDRSNFVATRRRYFKRTVRLPAVPSYFPGSLAETIKLPGLAGGPGGWIPTDTENALQMLEELETALPTALPERQSIETVQAVSPVFQNSDELAAWDADHEQDQMDAA